MVLSSIRPDTNIKRHRVLSALSDSSSKDTAENINLLHDHDIAFEDALPMHASVQDVYGRDAAEAAAVYRR